MCINQYKQNFNNNQQMITLYTNMFSMHAIVNEHRFPLTCDMVKQEIKIFVEFQQQLGNQLSFCWACWAAEPNQILSSPSNGQMESNCQPAKVCQLQFTLVINAHWC
jgi:hypothetical protein